MKRKMSKTHSTISTASYEPLITGENVTVKKKHGVLCASSHKRMYALMVLAGVALLWVFYILQTAESSI